MIQQCSLHPASTRALSGYLGPPCAGVTDTAGTRVVVPATGPRRIKLAISLSQSPLTPGQPVPALTLLHQAPGWAATGVPNFKRSVRLDLQKKIQQQQQQQKSASQGKRGTNSQLHRSRGGRLSTWPPGRSAPLGL